MSAAWTKRLLWIAACVYLVALLLLCLLPGSDLPQSPLNDKLEHALVYLPFCLILGLLFPGRLLRIVVAGIVLGGVIELLQGMTGYRDAQWLDWAADTVGVLISAGLLLCTQSWLIRYLRLSEAHG